MIPCNDEVSIRIIHFVLRDQEFHRVDSTGIETHFRDAERFGIMDNLFHQVFIPLLGSPQVEQHLMGGLLQLVAACLGRLLGVQHIQLS